MLDSLFETSFSFFPCWKLVGFFIASRNLKFHHEVPTCEAPIFSHHTGHRVGSLHKETYVFHLWNTILNNFSKFVHFYFTILFLGLLLSFFFSYFPLFCFSGLLQGKFPPLFLPFCYILNFHELFFFLTLIFYCTLMHTTYHFLISPKILIIAFFFFSLQVTLFCVCVCVCILCSCLFFLFPCVLPSSKPPVPWEQCPWLSCS